MTQKTDVQGRVFVLTTGDGSVHSVWTDPDALLDVLDANTPSAFDPDTWHIVSATVDEWRMPSVETAGYVQDVRRVLGDRTEQTT